MKCPLCQTENAPGAKFCSECGCDLRARTEVLPVFPAIPAIPTPEQIASERPAPDATLQFGDGPGDGVPTAPMGGGASTMPLGEGAEPSGTVAYTAAQMFGGTREMPPVGQPDTSGTERLASPFAPAGETARAFFSAGEGGAGAGNGPKKGSGRLSRKQVVAIVVASVLGALAIAAAGVTYAMELWGGHSVPDVVGMTQAKARTELEGAGFSVTALEVKSDDTENTVLLTDPGAGVRAAEGSEVTMHVAIARMVPDVVGTTEDEARSLMDGEGFQNVTYEPKKSNDPEGTVLAVSPEPGTKAQAKTPITVSVAQPYTVPDVAGKARDEAVAALEADGYVVTVDQVNTEDYPEGTAVTTDPPAGTKLNSGEAVTLFTAHNRSTELVELTRKMLDDASQLTINGGTYEVRSVERVEYNGDGVCSFTIVARPFATTNLPWFLGGGTKTEYGADETITGSVTWNADNTVRSVTSSAGDVKVS